MGHCPTVTECGNGVLLQCCHALLDADAEAVSFVYSTLCDTALQHPADSPMLSAPHDNLHA